MSQRYEVSAKRADEEQQERHVRQLSIACPEPGCGMRYRSQADLALHQAAMHAPAASPPMDDAPYFEPGTWVVYDPTGTLEVTDSTPRNIVISPPWNDHPEDYVWVAGWWGADYRPKPDVSAELPSDLRRDPRGAPE